MSTETPPALRRLNSIQVSNYRAIDSLMVELPAPQLEGDPDVLVVGSRNGVGKTSLLEAIAWGVLRASQDLDLDSLLETFSGRDAPAGRGAQLGDMVVRSGEESAQVSCRWEGEQSARNLAILANGTGFAKTGLAQLNHAPEAERIFGPLLGHTSDPLLLPPLVFLHSNRQLRPGANSMSDVVGARSAGAPLDFKSLMLRLLLAKGGSVEGLSEEEATRSLDQLNRLTEQFSGTRVKQFRPRGQGGDLEMLVHPVDGKPRHLFDSLSSGQKEIISTFFLIWQTTREHPSVVLIDEPEQHLNAEWQRRYVTELTRLAPWNQYVLATHSEEIFASVRPYQRLLLELEG